MAAYKDRVALVTGASSGIGAAIAVELAKAGVIVVGGARRVHKVEEIAKNLKGVSGRLIAKHLDVSKDDSVANVFKWIEEEFGGVDVLINNAGTFVRTPIHEQSVEQIRSLLDVNLLGAVLCSREAINSMLRRGVKDGYIINVNSVTGHTVPYIPNRSLGLYPPTKFALRAFSHTLRDTVRDAGLKTRVMNISPGITESEMTARSLASVREYMKAEDVANAVAYVLNLPARVEITEMTIQPTGEPMG